MNFFRTIARMIRPSEFSNGPEFRKRVEWLMLLRLLVTTVLLVTTILFQLRESGTFFVHPTIPLYVLIGALFLLSLVYAFSLPIIPDLWLFTFVQLTVDTVYATVLVYFTGGASSVFTLIYIFPIIGAGILLSRRGALATAVGACLLFGVLVDLEFYKVIPSSEWPWASPWSRNTPGYLIWLLVVHFTCFVFAAFIASSIGEQLLRTKLSLDRTEIDYRKLSELHTSIVRSIPSGIITTDERDKITFANNAATALLSTGRLELVGRPLKNIFAVIDELNSSKIRKETYITAKSIEGETKQMELTVSDLKGPDALPQGRLVVFQDVTRLRKMEERVKLSEKQAAFVRIAAGMAHEIRNPLAALRGATELLSQTDSSGDYEKKLLGIVIRESDRLNTLLGDFLLTVGSRQTNQARVMLTDIVEETIDLFCRDPKVLNGISVERLINKGVEVVGDSTKLKQAFWNLLVNALEATSLNGKGTIKVTLESDPNSRQALLSVQDWGCGIPPELKPRIFEPFTTTKEKGTGLGLSMVLSILEAHSGAIEVESSPGSGSRFTVLIPLAPVDGFDAGENND